MAKIIAHFSKKMPLAKQSYGMEQFSASVRPSCSQAATRRFRRGCAGCSRWPGSQWRSSSAQAW